MERKVNGFSNKIFVLMFSQFIIKIFGLIYTVFLTNKEGFGDTGNAVYMSGYQIYALFLAISSVGVPNAISKIISETIACKEIKSVERIFKISIAFFSILGFLETIILLFSSKFIAENILLISETEKTLIILSPAIFFVTISSVLKGYFNGTNNVLITAKMQVVEQILKTILIIFLVEIFSKLFEKNIEIMAVGVCLSITISSIISFIYGFLKYKNVRYFKSIRKNIININDKENFISILKRVLAIAVPISLSSFVVSINKNIDSITIVRTLEPLIGLESAKAKYGIISSKIDTLINMPLAFNISISTALIPEIAKYKITNDLKGLNEKIKASLQLSIIIGLPCTFGMFLYSQQILEILYPNAPDGSVLLAISSFSIIFSMLTQTVNGALQGIGKSKIPVIAFVFGIVLKFFLNIFLMKIKGIYENGVAIANVASNILVFSIVFYSLKNSIKLNFKIYDIILKPWLVTIIMCIISYCVYLTVNVYFYEKIAILAGILCAIFIYSFIIFNKKIGKITKILKKRRILATFDE